MEEQEEKNALESKEKKESPQKSSEKEKAKGEKKMDLIIFLLLLIPAIIKDAIEMILGFLPGINFFAWMISVPFTAFIFFVTIITGTRGTWIFAGHLIDLLPIASILPIATCTIIFCYMSQNAPASIKKTIKRAA
jgi:cation transport ATPase